MEFAGDWAPNSPPASPLPVLEINLISAQGLKVPSNNFIKRQTYAVAWVDSSDRLRTRIDAIGGSNPTWNDKFLFRVTPEFLARETSAVSIEIYALGCFCDSLVGTVRFLVGNVIALNDCTRTPAFTAVQVRRPSGRFQGVLNIGVMVNHNSDFASLSDVSAIGYRDLMGKSFRRRRLEKSRADDSHEASLPESPELSEISESSPTNSDVLKDLNGAANLGRAKTLRRASSGSGFLCCLVMQKKAVAATAATTTNLRSSEKSFKISAGSPDMER